MLIKARKRIIMSLLVTVWLCPHILCAYGLRTGFGKVILENIPMGREYSMRRDSQFPLVIENNSDKEIELKLEVLAPEEGEIQEGYEAIPDANWITLERNSFIVGPNGKTETDVVINIPNNEDYLGRRFHVFIWSYTVGEAVGIGIKSKLLFSVGEAKKE